MPRMTLCAGCKAVIRAIDRREDTSLARLERELSLSCQLVNRRGDIIIGILNTLHSHSRIGVLNERTAPGVSLGFLDRLLGDEELALVRK